MKAMDYCNCNVLSSTTSTGLTTLVLDSYLDLEALEELTLTGKYSFLNILDTLTSRELYSLQHYRMTNSFIQIRSKQKYYNRKL
jgi:hypothetical protein